MKAESISTELKETTEKTTELKVPTEKKAEPSESEKKPEPSESKEQPLEKPTPPVSSHTMTPMALNPVPEEDNFATEMSKAYK